MAEAVNYITDAELLTLGLPGAALSDVPVDVRDSARANASAVASSHLKKRFALPLVAFGADIRRAVAHMASYDVMTFRGFDPGSESGVLVVKRHDDALAWLRDVARGIVEPVDVTDSTPDTDEQGPLVSSDPGAGWQWPTSSNIEEGC